MLLTTVDGQSLQDQPGSYIRVTAEDDDDDDRTKNKQKELQESRNRSIFSAVGYRCRLTIDKSSRKSLTCTSFMQNGLAQRCNTNGISLFLWETFAQPKKKIKKNCLLP